MCLSLIVAHSKNLTIGLNGGIPWKQRADMKRFKGLTSGHNVIMGRKTFESLKKPLPNRVNIVLTSSDHPNGVKSLDDAISLCKNDDQPFVIGGANVYAQAIPLCNRLYITEINTTIVGDTYFPNLDWSKWELVEESHHDKDINNQFPYSFKTFFRIQT